MYRSLKSIASLVKFAHTVFALPFACIGFAYAVRDVMYFPVWAFLLMLLCMVCARNAAMSFNRYADRKFDARNRRTANREIPRGIITPQQAWWFSVVNMALFVLATALLNPLCLYLSPAALLIIIGYSYTKRFTALCHLILGISLSIAPIGAYIAVTGEFAVAPLCFSAIMLFWAAGFDVLYALPDEEFDKKEGLHSIPAALGQKTAMKLSILMHITAAILTILTGLLLRGGCSYWAGATLFIALLVYQHCIVKPGNLQRLNAAFFTTNGIASVLFAILVIVDAF